MNAASKTTHFDWLDIAKGIAFVFVIIGHTLSVESSVRHLIFSFHMPLFFILAGYTFRTKPLKAQFISSFKRLLIPYLLIFCIWQIPNLLINTPVITYPTIMSAFLQLVFASGTDVPTLGIRAIGTSWFLVSLFIARLLMNALALVFDNRDPHLIKQGILCLIALALGVTLGESLNMFLPLSFDISLVALFFMWVGRFARKAQFEPLLSNWKTLLISLTIWLFSAHFSYLELAARRYTMLPLGITAALAGTLFFCCIAKKLEPDTAPTIIKPIGIFTRFCGRNGMLLYCLHCIDWWIPWTSLPALSNLPMSHTIASVIRVAYNALFVRLVKRA